MSTTARVLGVLLCYYSELRVCTCTGIIPGLQYVPSLESSAAGARLENPKPLQQIRCPTG